MMRVRSHGLTDTGLLRTHNEDYLGVDDGKRVYLVADGMGGHNHGEVASRIAVESIRAFMANGDDLDHTLSVTSDGTLRRHSSRFKRSIHIAHNEVLEAIEEDGSLLGMGTTVVGAMLRDEVAAIVHVGDSRAYRLRGGHLELMTQDHTWVNEQVVAGYLSEEQAKSHPLKNVVTRALGGDSDVLVDVSETRVKDGDLYLLCSDGLTTMLSDQDIHRILSVDAPLEDVCRRLVEEANARGGFDNVTVLLFRVEQMDDAEEETMTTRDIIDTL